MEREVFARRLVRDDEGEVLPRDAGEEGVEDALGEDGGLPEEEGILLRCGLSRVEAVDVLAWVGKGGFNVTSTFDGNVSRKVSTLRELDER